MDLMIVIGGRSDQETKSLPIEIYDIDNAEWYQTTKMDKFRHCTWAQGSQLFVHGGFDLKSPNVANNNLSVVPLDKIGLSDARLAARFAALKKVADKKETLTPNISPQESRINEKRSNTKKMLENRPLKEDKVSRIKINKPYSVGKKELADVIIETLMRPAEWADQERVENEVVAFPFDSDAIKMLAKDCAEIMFAQPMLLRINAPVKIFGDIHGQFCDLMRFFNEWGEPSESVNGDIEAIDYLFLGDYVDRGVHCLETICLLMALKVKYPEKIHLLRGNHEDKLINAYFGFYDECSMRINEEDVPEAETVFYAINSVFEYMPLAAVVDDQIFCLHGGIGANLRDIAALNYIQRPLEIVHEATTLEEKIVE